MKKQIHFLKIHFRGINHWRVNSVLRIGEKQWIIRHNYDRAPEYYICMKDFSGYFPLSYTSAIRLNTKHIIPNHQ